MNTTTGPGTTDSLQKRRAAALAACDRAADHMYDAEVALHIARQTGVDAWVNAACNTLHEAIEEHMAAIRLAAATAPPAPRARYRNGTVAIATRRTA